MPRGDEKEEPDSPTTPPVEANEIVVRQIKEGGGQPLFFDATQASPPVVHRSLFLPSPKDVDGLSMIRLRYRGEAWAAYRSETPDQRYRLARLLPSSLIECARAAGIEWLHFNPAPDDLDREHGQPWAHCNVQEINRRDYDNKSDPAAKMRIMTWADKVSKLVALADVSNPYPAPGPQADSYRPAID
jgi:hypothetical protein